MKSNRSFKISESERACHGYFLSVAILSVAILSVAILSVAILSVAILSVAILLDLPSETR